MMSDYATAQLLDVLGDKIDLLKWLLAEKDHWGRWLLAKKEWQARADDGVWHFDGCTEDGQVLRWLLAESEYKRESLNCECEDYAYHVRVGQWLTAEQRYLRWMDQRSLLDMAAKVNKWETWSREGELEPQEANDIYRWLIREAQFTVSQAYDIYRWLLAEQEWHSTKAVGRNYEAGYDDGYLDGYNKGAYDVG